MIDVELLRDKGIAVITPEGRLEASDFERVGHEINPYLKQNGKLNGLLVQAKSFPGWADFAALTTHIRFVKDHHRLVRRVAIVSDSLASKIMPALAQHFVSAEIRHFGFDERQQAIAWLEAAASA